MAEWVKSWIPPTLRSQVQIHQSDSSHRCFKQFCSFACSARSFVRSPPSWILVSKKILVAVKFIQKMFYCLWSFQCSINGEIILKMAILGPGFENWQVRRSGACCRRYRTCWKLKVQVRRDLLTLFLFLKCLSKMKIMQLACETKYEIFIFNHETIRVYFSAWRKPVF